MRLRVTVTGVERVDDHQAVQLELESTGIANYDGEFTQAAVTYGDGTHAAGRRGRERTVLEHLGPADACPSRSGAKTTGCLLFPTSGSESPTRFQLALETVPTEAGGIWNLG